VAGSLNSRKLKFCVASGGKKVPNTANICDKLSVKKLRASFSISVSRLQQQYISICIYAYVVLFGRDIRLC